jgi:hypothetical protein
MHATTRHAVGHIVLWGALCGFALMWAFGTRRRRTKSHITEAQLDEMIRETFPASDAPSY